jgi:hypothetical protein
LLEDILGDGIEVRNRIEGREAEDSITTRFKKHGPLGIVSDSTRLAVLRSVKLDNDLRAVTGEVGEIFSYWCLASEMKSMVLSTTQRAPHQPFPSVADFLKRRAR